MRALLIIYLVVLSSFFIACNSIPESIDISSPVVKAKFQKLTTHDEMMAFLAMADSLNGNIQLEVLGSLGDDYVMPVVKIATKKTNKHKVKVMILAQQHGDEPSGKEAVLELIAGFADGRFDELLKNLELYIFPQVNPWGGDHDVRRNKNDLDLNRDHLLLQSKEDQFVHHFFHNIKPQVTIDVHEYDPYYQEWTDFGYYKNADVQLGGLTNPMANKKITDLFYQKLLPTVQKDVETSGYSFTEYTLGQIYNEEGRLRHSTVHIDDGRQSFGLMQTLSMIIEGKYGHNSIDNLQRRTESQYTILQSILKNLSLNKRLVLKTVEEARINLVNRGPQRKFGVRFTHVQNGQKFAFPLWSIEEKKDTIFMVDRYYPERETTYSVDVPVGYLVASNDSLLIDWMNMQKILYTSFSLEDGMQVMGYKIEENTIKKSFEGWEFIDLNVQQEMIYVNPEQYVFIPIHQWSAKKIILAFEPQSMLALINEAPFSYLLESEDYPILKVVHN
ncbi:MAG: hypothetical protein C0599_00810 [Salinivirgaceae bacterium]|nr:MAG: hypothetical protein C0599_00810 [Salinivirgaceae bacterium]